MPLLDEKDKKLLNFLKKQKNIRRQMAFASVFCFLGGVFLLVTCFIDFYERFFYGGLLMTGVSYMTFTTNNKFVRILELIEKISNNQIVDEEFDWKKSGNWGRKLGSE